MINSADDLSKEEIDRIKRKLKSYKIQDNRIISRNKILYDDFTIKDRLKFNDCIEIIMRNGLICYLCNMPVKILTHSYYGKQFTLDRINNNDTHNKDNVKICCLTCNKLKSNQYNEKQFLKFFN